MNKKEKYRRTFKGVLSSIYDGQKHSSKVRGHPKPTYSKEELKEWLLEQKNFSILFKGWEESGYDSKMKPSVDRLDDNLGYSFDNIRLVTWGENEAKRWSVMKGENNHASNSKEHYSKKSTRRSRFKRTCNRMGWNFNDFEEVFDGERSGGHKKFIYLYNGGN